MSENRHARESEAKHDLLVALGNLVDEVAGIGLFALDVRKLIGDTNWNVLSLRLQEARDIMAQARGDV